MRRVEKFREETLLQLILRELLHSAETSTSANKFSHISSLVSLSEVAQTPR
jgi:hypothetical protein